jgi:hypothetical protein
MDIFDEITRFDVRAGAPSCLSALKSQIRRKRKAVHSMEFRVAAKPETIGHSRDSEAFRDAQRQNCAIISLPLITDRHIEE